MATVTGLTAERMLEIEASSVVDGHIDEEGHLILVRHDESEIDAGNALVAVPDASTTVKGVVELATAAEVTAGTDATRAITPATLAEGYILPEASDSQKGIVELATQAETETGTDVEKAVTPAAISPTISALDSRISDLEAEPGERVVLLSTDQFEESDPGTDYPEGISMMTISSGHFPSLGGLGWVVTYYRDNSRLFQEFHRHQTNERWKRTYYFTFGWTDWEPVNGHIVTDLITITPVANTPTSLTWNYGKTLRTPVRVFANPHTTVIETTVKGVATSSSTSSSVIVWVYRTNTTDTLINVMAVGS